MKWCIQRPGSGWWMVDGHKNKVIKCCVHFDYETSHVLIRLALCFAKIVSLFQHTQHIALADVEMISTWFSIGWEMKGRNFPIHHIIWHTNWARILLCGKSNCCSPFHTPFELRVCALGYCRSSIQNNDNSMFFR